MGDKSPWFEYTLCWSDPVEVESDLTVFNVGGDSTELDIGLREALTEFGMGVGEDSTEFGMGVGEDSTEFGTGVGEDSTEFGM